MVSSSSVPSIDTNYGQLPTKVLRFLVYSHGWLAIGMATQVLWMGHLFGFSATVPAIAIATGSIAAYGFMRILRSLEPDPIPSPNIHWVIQNRWVVILLSVITAIVSLIAVRYSYFVFGAWTAVAAILVVLYLTPMRNKKGSSIGLRNVPLLKAPLIALVCTLATIGLSGDEVVDVERQLLKLIAIPQFAFFLAITTTYDIADIDHDDPKLRTFPQLIGVKATKWLAVFLLLPWFAFYGFSTFAFRSNYYLPIIGLIITAVVISRAEPWTNEWYYKVWLDGILILIPLLGWLGGLL